MRSGRDRLGRPLPSQPWSDMTEGDEPNVRLKIEKAGVCLHGEKIMTIKSIENIKINPSLQAGKPGVYHGSAALDGDSEHTIKAMTAYLADQNLEPKNVRVVRDKFQPGIWAVHYDIV